MSRGRPCRCSASARMICGGSIRLMSAKMRAFLNWTASGIGFSAERRPNWFMIQIRDKDLDRLSSGIVM